jgi:hypothetical protein
MELLAERDPEEALKILDPVVEPMMKSVRGYGQSGDGRWHRALFGAPLTHEDHAVRACYAALRMQDTVKRHAEEVRRTGGLNVDVAYRTLRSH